MTLASIPDGTASVSHGSLSSRTKKIYEFAQKTRTLRPAHAGLLMELLNSFDWSIPDNPKSRLDFHLAEMRTWKDVPEDLRASIVRFLDRYREARSTAKRVS
jgi:hypothetical protein